MAVNPIAFHSSQYQVVTDIYSGPLDLLLDLIEKAELDITVLSLAQVTDQFLNYVSKMDRNQLGEASAFIVIAARLILIKSTALLPKSSVVIDNLDEDSGEQLAQQLIVYRRFKQLMSFLAEREDKNLETVLRMEKPDLNGLFTEVDLAGLTAEDLSEIASEVFSEREAAIPLNTVMKAPRVTIREKINLLVSELKRKKKIPFGSLLKNGTRMDAVVTFLAMLELIKQNAIVVEQKGTFEAIEIQGGENLNSDKDFVSEFGE